MIPDKQLFSPGVRFGFAPHAGPLCLAASFLPVSQSDCLTIFLCAWKTIEKRMNFDKSSAVSAFISTEIITDPHVSFLSPGEFLCLSRLLFIGWILTTDLFANQNNLGYSFPAGLQHICLCDSLFEECVGGADIVHNHDIVNHLQMRPIWQNWVRWPARSVEHGVH